MTYETWKEKLQAISLATTQPNSDLYGLHVPSMSALFGSRNAVTTDHAPLTVLYREKLTESLSRMDLFVDVHDAREVFAPGTSSSDKDLEDFLLNRGIYFELVHAYDLFVSVTLRTDDPNFDFFFALRLVFADLMEIEKFLDHHLEHSFKTDVVKFQRFLNPLLKKYAPPSAATQGMLVLPPEKQTIVEQWIGHSKPTAPAHMDKKHNASDWNFPDFTMNQWALLMHFGVAAAGAEARQSGDVTDLARLLHAVLGREMKSIQNSEIYKKCRTLFDHRVGLLDDLHRVKQVFETAKYEKAIELINKKIKDLGGEIKI